MKALIYLFSKPFPTLLSHLISFKINSNQKSENLMDRSIESIDLNEHDDLDSVRKTMEVLLNESKREKIIYLFVTIIVFKTIRNFVRR
jgi:hypothetical protein